MRARAVASVPRRLARALGLEGFEAALAGLAILLMLGIYAVYVVNVTEWVLRVGGVKLRGRIPDLLGMWDGLAPALTLAAGAVLGRLIGRAHARHRVVRIVTFGAATIGCAVLGLQTATWLAAPIHWPPGLFHQVAITTAFIIGLIGGVGSSMMRRPSGLSLADS